ncbi:MAG TPA: UdgX family uracil-DNA binding protein [Acidimicrobiales bacterium]|nr:UdgX family uracil-DNA binding protein [Acidimicrobiales bacterium]
MRHPTDDPGSPSPPDRAERERQLAARAASAARCTRCDLYRRATQVVYGHGAVDPHLMLVGEQPGDQEDRAGRPFVGPAGRVLDEALHEAGLRPTDVYLTNAVKHFKWQPRGKRRIHQKPDVAEIHACATWLEDEMDLVRPAVVVCLGVTAARAVLGRPTTISAVRGRVLEGSAPRPVVVTIHPSAVLRAREGDDRAALRAGLVADLVVARRAA